MAASTRFRCGYLPLLLLAALTLPPAATAAAEPAPAPKLVVLISVDQLSGVLFDAWRGRFHGGFARLDGGIVYANGYQSHAATETCPGHSTLLTGAYPSHSGIVANDWYDVVAGHDVYCVSDPEAKLAHDPSAEGVSPKNLLVPTLGDRLKAASPGSRVVAIAGKDRAAITMAGHEADAVFWFTDKYGYTTTLKSGQTAAQALAPLAAFNEATQRGWKEAPPFWNYAHEECRSLEADYRFGDTAWRSMLPPSGWNAKDPAGTLKNEFRASPFFDQLTLDAARQLIQQQRLGQRGVTDLLAIGLSATDYIGHRYGTQGPEMCDHLQRLDEMLGGFLSSLDRLGQPYVVALTADHGGSDFPERLAARGYDAGRIDPKGWLAPINAAVKKELELDFEPLYGGDISQLYLLDADKRPLAEPMRGKAVESALRLLRQRPEVALATTLDEVLAAPDATGVPADELSLMQRLAQSSHRGRSGDLLLVLKPYLLPSTANPGRYLSGHGTPWNYDRRVPILFWWKGAPAQERFLPVETVDIGPTLAAIMGVRMPAAIDGRCLDLGIGACTIAPPR